MERDHPLANEWAIVCDAPGFAACLAGRERQTTGERVFEMLWSVEPGRGAGRRARSAWTSPARTCRTWTRASPSACPGRPAANADGVARATSVTNRMLAYVAASA